jgi:hypothetical protein
MSIISIHQPNYIPWIGYFYKISQSHIFVFLDDAQFSNEGMHNYHYIKTPQGPFRLKIPVRNQFGTPINKVVSKDDLGWKKKHLDTLYSNYRRAKYFDIIFDDFRSLIEKKYNNLAIMNIDIITFICMKFGINTHFVRSSSLFINLAHEERIIAICKSLGADVYYSGTGAKSYQDENHFTDNGIALKYSNFNAFEYPQLWGNFQKNVTVLDYLMNCGYDWERVVENQDSN